MDLLRREDCVIADGCFGGGFFYLSFYRLTFPATSHITIITLAVGCNFIFAANLTYSAQIWVFGRLYPSCAGGYRQFHTPRIHDDVTRTAPKQWGKTASAPQ